MKKTLLSFLCIGSACLVMAQTTPSSTPTQNRTNTNTNTNSVNQPNNTQNGTNNNLNSTNNRNTTTSPSTPATTGNGTVHGHNTMTNENRSNPGNSNMNNTPANSTLNSTNTPNGNMNNGTMNNMNNTDMNSSGRLGNTTNSAAYSSVTVPSSVQTSFNAAYPAAGSNVVWSQSGDWYRARYRGENGQLMEAAYREDGKSFTRAASPIMKTYVPEEIVNKALDMYGMNVYAIAQSKGTEGHEVYHVTVIDNNGQSRTEWMNADGSSLMSPYRTETDATMQNSTNTNMNAAEQTSGEPASDVQQPSAPVPDSSQMLNNDMQDPMNDQETIDQGERQEDNDVTPDPQTSKEGINNGSGSQDTLRRMSDEQSPETPQE